MTRRVCGSCRFFKAAGFDNMGWCTHPKRRMGTDALLFVRSLELHCRNDWASDLWQRADDVGATPAGPSPEAPATIDEIRLLTASQRQSGDGGAARDAAARGEDVVVGEVPTDVPAADVTRRDGAKSSLRRAHEELRLRNRERRTGLTPAAEFGEFNQPIETVSAEPDGERLASADKPVATPPALMPPAMPAGEVSPVSLGELGRPFPKMTTFPDDAEVFSSIPVPVEGFDLPLIDRPKPARIVGRAGFDDDGDIAPWTRTGDPEQPDAAYQPRGVRAQPGPTPSLRRAETVRPAEGARPADRSVADTQLTQVLPRRPAVEHDDFDPTTDDGRRRPARMERPMPRADERRRVSAIDPEVAAALVERIVAGSPGPAFEAATAPDAEGRDERRQAPRRSERLVDDGYVAALDAEEDDAAAAFPGVPRMCRTCRDFRPSESGDRGWCTNKWAFSHRRMVDADELPCETTVGGWWLASDEVWLSTLDVSAHSQPTPLLDEWLAARAAAEQGYEANSPLRRRRRS